MDIAAAQDAFDRVGTPDAHRPARAAGRRRRDVARAAQSATCRRASPSTHRGRARTPRRACRARTASTSTCWRWSRCSPAACWCSRRRRCRWCGAARNSRCCARWGSRAARWLALLVVEGALVGAAARCWACSRATRSRVAAMRVFGGDLGAGFFRGVAPRVAVDPLAALVIFGALGIAVAALGSARSRARSRARGAGRGAEGRRRADGLPAAAPRGAWRASCWSPARCAALLPPVADLPLFGYLAIALLLVGTLLLMPRIATFLLAHVPTPRCVPAALALDQLRGAPGQATVEPRHHRRERLADGVDGDHGRVVPPVARRLARRASCRPTCTCAPGRRATARSSAPTTSAASPRCAGVRRVEFLRVQSVLARSGAAARRAARARPSGATIRLARCRWSARRRRRGARRSAAGVGQRSDGRSLRLQPGPRDHAAARRPRRRVHRRRRVARLRAAAGRDRDRPRDYMRADRRPTANDAALWLDAGARSTTCGANSKRAVRRGGALDVRHAGRDPRALAAHLRPHVRRDLRARSGRGRASAWSGLSSSFGALVLARRREFGMLRHLGMTRRQIAAMLATEGLAVSGIGLVVGLVLGWRDEPHPDPRRQPPVVPLEHGRCTCRGRPLAGARGRAAGARGGHDARQRARRR